MERVICKLYLEQKPLCKSHLIPRAAYQYCCPLGGNPIVANAKLVIESSRQIQFPLLCRPCEHALNDGGENWVIPLFAKYDGTFGFFDLLKQIPPDVTEDGFDGYATTKNAAIAGDKLIHFALGIFWKAAVHSWEGGKTGPLIDLDKYREHVRMYLRGESSFPERMALSIGVIRPPVTEVAFLAPFRTQEAAFHRFYFYTSGICWTLGVGKAVNEEIRQASFAFNPLRPIVVGDFKPEVQFAFRSILRFATRARNVEKYLKPRNK
jgi:hypothetical protein